MLPSINCKAYLFIAKDNYANHRYCLDNRLSKDILNNLDETNSFYLSELGLDEKDGSVTVANSKFVFASKHGGRVSLNDIEIKKNPESASWRIVPKFNLGGIEAKGISMSWVPFYTVDGCDQDVGVHL